MTNLSYVLVIAITLISAGCLSGQGEEYAAESEVPAGTAMIIPPEAVAESSAPVSPSANPPVCENKATCLIDLRPIEEGKSFTMNLPEGKFIIKVVSPQSSASFFCNEHCVELAWCDTEDCENLPKERRGSAGPGGRHISLKPGSEDGTFEITLRVVTNYPVEFKAKARYP